MRAPAACAALALVLLGASGATAQGIGIRCSAFLHERDGAWRSFEDGTVLAPEGPVPVTTGERFTRGGSPAQRALVHALDAYCLAPPRAPAAPPPPFP